MESVDAFNDLLLTCLDKHATVKSVKLRHKPNPFITDEIRELMSSRDRMHKLACKTGSDNDWKAFLDKKKEVKRVIWSAEREHFNQEIAENRNTKVR